MLRRAFAIAALVGSLAVPAVALAGGANLLRVLASPISSAKQHGRKVLVPSTINPHTAHVYGSGGATAKGYDIELGAVPNCGAATACFVADFLSNPGNVTLKTHVALAHGIIGGYHPVSCGASCAPATIEWKEYGMLYTIQLAGGTQASMVALANSAITAGPR